MTDSAAWAGQSSADILADVRAAAKKLTETTWDLHTVFPIHPAHYRKAQDLLGVYDRPLTEADLWAAAEIELEQNGETWADVYRHLFGEGTTPA